MRLWVFVSVVWLSLMVVMGVTILFEDYDREPNFDNIFYKLTDKTKEFYRDNKNIEENPYYVLSIKHLDGEEFKVRIDLMDESEQESIMDRFAKYVTEEKKVSESELKTVLKTISLKNKEAFSAKQEFDDKVNNFKSENIQRRNESIIQITMTALIPPIVILLLGQGVAWVRRGFRLDK